MGDAEDVKTRMSEAWKAAAARAYEAAHGLVDEGPAREAPPWRWRMSARVGVTVAMALVLVALMVVWWPDAPTGAAVPLPGDEANAARAGLGTGQGAVVRSGVTHGVVTVHVAGAVATPGLYELPLGARVADAIDAAGGPVDPADLNQLNLARVVMDGEKVAVGLREDEHQSLINLNSAAQDRLSDLPGVGPVLAARIVAYRDAHGPFARVDDLEAVPGVGPAVLAGLRDVATV